MVSGRRIALQAVDDGFLFVSRIENLNDPLRWVGCAGGVYAALEAGSSVQIWNGLWHTYDIKWLIQDYTASYQLWV